MTDLKTARHGLIVILLLLANVLTVVPVRAENTLTPQQIRALPPFPREFVDGLKSHENFRLYTGKIQHATWDEENNDVGYGFTNDENEDAIREGFSPPGTKLPRSFSKRAADWRLEHITLPTYRSIIRKIVDPKIHLTLNQEFALVAFVQNTGITNAKKLIAAENRLNDGNYKIIAEKMPLYYTKSKGLIRRGQFQVDIWENREFTPKT